jgi:hypothetical protein
MAAGWVIYQISCARTIHIFVSTGSVEYTSTNTVLAPGESAPGVNWTHCFSLLLLLPLAATVPDYSTTTRLH